MRPTAGSTGAAKSVTHPAAARPAAILGVATPVVMPWRRDVRQGRSPR